MILSSRSALLRVLGCQHVGRACPCPVPPASARTVTTFHKRSSRHRLDPSLAPNQKRLPRRESESVTKTQASPSRFGVKTRSKPYEVEPPRPRFERDSAPHEGVETPLVGEREVDKEKLERHRKYFEQKVKESKADGWTQRGDDLEEGQVPRMDNVEQIFDYKAPAVDSSRLPHMFSSPPLHPALQQAIYDLLGPSARPTPIQGLALQHLFSQSKTYRQVLLAAETGSGKSLAYLLPMLQHIKQTEPPRPRRPRPSLVSPRGLVLAPTHELSRQLSYFAKQLIHRLKLRVQTTSRTNIPSLDNKHRATASRMSGAFANTPEGEFRVTPAGYGDQRFDVDVLFGTTRRLLDMVRGNGWKKAATQAEELSRREQPWQVGRPEVSLHDVEWVVIDEADVLLDPDFAEETRGLLSDISAARGYTVPESGAIDYPFNLLITSATIPLAQTNSFYSLHPRMERLVSPGVHRLPKRLTVEFAQYGSGSKQADVERRLRDLWTDDALAGRPPSRVVVFTNGRTTAQFVGDYLKTKGIPNVTITGFGGTDRAFGSNKHLSGFIGAAPAPPPPENTEDPDAKETPRVLVCTAVLARGLDFSPDVSTVFLYDAPQTAADFLHRAGRTARGGRPGRVVVFERNEGRGRGRAAVLRQSIAALANKKQMMMQ